MGIFSGLFKSRDKPTNSYDSPSYAYFFGRSNAGKRVTDRTALQHIAVYACVRVLSEAIAQLPLHVYKYNDSGKERVPQHPLYFLLHDQPNPEMTSFVFRETLMSHLLIYGNAYAQIIRNGRGEVVGLYPLLPDRMTVDRDDKNRLIYRYSCYENANPNLKKLGELVSTINDMSVKIGQAEKTQTEFISSVSHELRTPLTAISGWGETLLTSENLDAETRRGVVIIAREAKRLTGMVEELLEFTRMQDGRFTLHVETADILAEFEDTVFMYGNRLKQEGICLHYDGCDEEIPEIPCDVARMRQVFLNILDNAAKHGGEGKRIDASIAHEGSFVVIRMRDYGPGIPEEELPHVKLKFYKGSSKARGSGIGLAVCEEIVTMHGGTLTLENAEGGGTLVTISIPTGEE